METFDNKRTQTAYREHIGFKEQAGNWISRSPKFEKLVEKAKLYFKNPEKLNQMITEVYNKATNEAGNKTIADMWDKIQTLAQMIKYHVKGEYKGISTGKIVVGIAVLLYFLLPFDIVPDFIPLAGYADDLTILGWFIKSSAREIEKYKEWDMTKFSTIIPTY